MSTLESEDDIQRDVTRVRDITAVPTILNLVCRLTGVGFAAIARVTDGRWIACETKDDIEFGLESGGELDVSTTLCKEVREGGQPIVIDHVSDDAYYCGHPVPAVYGFQSYISMPIRLPDGTFFGTLCAIDPEPRELNTPETLETLRLFADLIGFHLDAQDRIAESETALSDERETAQLREQFIAVLGHDLRNPLASIDSGVNMLRRAELDEKEAKIVLLMQRSTKRMAGLIDNVMDFARGRLGGGLTLNTQQEDLGPILQQVVDELSAAWPEREILMDISLEESVICDAARMSQLFSNLLANAVTHGEENSPIRLAARAEDEQFVFSIENEGGPIPEAVREHLFQPFFRGGDRPSQQGLGLGLFISNQIVRAHGGTLDVASDHDRTRFTLTMPAR